MKYFKIKLIFIVFLLLFVQSFLVFHLIYGTKSFYTLAQDFFLSSEKNTAHSISYPVDIEVLNDISDGAPDVPRFQNLFRLSYDSLMLGQILPPAQMFKVTTKPVIWPSNVNVKTVTVASGDTLISLLGRHRVEMDQSMKVIDALKAVYDPKDLKVGQTVDILSRASSPNSHSRFIGLRFEQDGDTEFSAKKKGDNFVAIRQNIPLFRKLLGATGTINTNFYDSAQRADLPNDVLMRLIGLLSYQVDFQREIQQGDRFQVLYEVYENEKGEVIKTGQIVYAAMILSGKQMDLYRYQFKNGKTSYFNREGKTFLRSLMKTPIHGARLSSRYGKRRHPVLGYHKMHRGVDFAAPVGTPIYAAGDGVVERANWYSTYGRYVRIRHVNSYATAYAHLSRFKKGIYAGKRVKQGEVIGYVGASGRVTGPHLHYEILYKGKRINPLKLKVLPRKKLKGEDFSRFQKHVSYIEKRVFALLREPVFYKLAQMNMR